MDRFTRTHPETLDSARRTWVDGGSHVPYLRSLLRDGRRDHALRLGLSLLADGCVGASEQADVDGLLVAELRLTAGARALVERLVAEPTLEGYQALTRFWQSSDRDLQLRYVAARLARAGVDGDVVFTLLASDGPSEALAALVVSGTVDPAGIVAYAAELSVAERATYLGLAARAAAVRGQAFVAVRMLCEARSLGRDPFSIGDDLVVLRAHGEAWVERALTAAGFDHGTDVA